MSYDLPHGTDLRVVTLKAAAAALRRDFATNRRDPKARFVMISFRMCQMLMGDLRNPRLLSYPIVALHRFATEWCLGLELRPKTIIGGGLSIFHGFGLVVNDQAVIGSDVKLRNGVTIGHKEAGKGAPVIGNGVDVGANATIIGNIRVGEGATIGAGAVVVKDVAAFTTVAGNPARPLVPRSIDRSNLGTGGTNV
jgi:putative colanic acid biosynthesis acetyltransferase WcaB